MNIDQIIARASVPHVGDCLTRANLRCKVVRVSARTVRYSIKGVRWRMFEVTVPRSEWSKLVRATILNRSEFTEGGK